MHWTELETTGTVPVARGYHTSTLVKSHFIVYGGSDGLECFSDAHVLDLGNNSNAWKDVRRLAALVFFLNVFFFLFIFFFLRESYDSFLS
jgi:hypothetical protein